MAYLENYRDPGQTAAEVQARLPAQPQLDARCSIAGWAGRHQPSNPDSLFRSRPNYRIPCGLYSLPSRKLSLVLTALLFAASGAAQAAIINARSPSLADVSNAIAAASDGDTVIIPAGTASWTSTLNITKGITLIGQTTITGTPPNQTVNDATKIQDDTPRSGSGIIKVSIVPSQAVRISGLTFVPGAAASFSSSNSTVQFSARSSTPAKNARLDHCHFASIWQGRMIGTGGWIYPVIDHNLFEHRANSGLAILAAGSYGGPGYEWGDGAWADYPWYGTDNFTFFEDNMIKGVSGGSTTGGLDADYGARFVCRHNYFWNTSPSTHGTEGGRLRGVRAVEFYNNTIEWTTSAFGSGQRSGTSLWHDNTYLGASYATPEHTKLANYRETPARGASLLWGVADGRSIWDQNITADPATEASDGTYVEAHASTPYVFAQGTASINGTQTGASGTMTDNTKNWTTDQWLGYSIENTNPNNTTAYKVGSFILGNDAHTITYWYYAANDTGGKFLKFLAGDSYIIRKVLNAMDQNGSGKGDLVSGSSTAPVNSKVGKPFWPHQAVEPCYSWNNVHRKADGTQDMVLGYGIPKHQPTTQLGKDYFNLGAGFPADTTPSQVSSRYVASLNGVDYKGPFTYPHPLVSGASPSPTPAQTPSAPTNLRVTGP